jgi:hypothetical protein
MGRTAALIFSIFLIANTFAQATVIEATTVGVSRTIPPGDKDYNRGSPGRR